jgi:ATP-dependent protease ClpP protease subunit
MQKIELYGDVGTQITVDSFRAILNENKDEDLQLDISTLGGDLNTGLIIHDLLKAHKGKTIANIVGLTASAGTVIALGCDEIQMSENALFLIHNGWKTITGNIYDFEQGVDDMKKTDSIMVKIYHERTGLAPEKIITLMKQEDWMTAYEAKDLGFVDTVVQSQKIAASAVLEGAQGSINDVLLTKLKEKMKIFGKEKASNQVLNTLTLADGSQLVFEGKSIAANVKVAPLGDATLEDGEYELKDGRKISVAGNVITEVKEPEPEPELSGEQLMETVAEMLTASEAKIEAMIEAKLKPLSAAVSVHKPEKVQPVINKSRASQSDDLQAKIEAKMAENRANVESKRKGA